MLCHIGVIPRLLGWVGIHHPGAVRTIKHMLLPLVFPSVLGGVGIWTKHVFPPACCTKLAWIISQAISVIFHDWLSRWWLVGCISLGHSRVSFVAKTAKLVLALLAIPAIFQTCVCLVDYVLAHVTLVINVYP